MRRRILTIAALVTATLLIGTSPAWINGEWKKALGGLVVIALMAAAGWFGYAFGYGIAKAEQIFTEELDPRPDPDDDPDPFAMQRRVYPDTDTTGENR